MLLNTTEIHGRHDIKIFKIIATMLTKQMIVVLFKSNTTTVILIRGRNNAVRTFCNKHYYRLELPTR